MARVPLLPNPIMKIIGKRSRNFGSAFKSNTLELPGCTVLPSESTFFFDCAECEDAVVVSCLDEDGVVDDDNDDDDDDDDDDVSDDGGAVGVNEENGVMVTLMKTVSTNQGVHGVL